MANRNDIFIDDLLKSSSDAYDFYARKNIKDKFIEDVNSCTFVSGISSYLRVSQYSLFNDTDKNTDRIRYVASELLAIGNNLSFTITSEKGYIHAILGVFDSSLAKNIIIGKLNDVEIEDSPSVLYVDQRYNGVIVSDSEIRISAIDDLINTMGNSSYTVSVVCTKCTSDEIRECKNTINEHIKAYSPYTNSENKLAIQSQYASNNNSIQLLCDMLKAKTTLLDNAIYKVWILLSAEDNITYRNLAQTSKSIFSASSDTSPALFSFKHKVFDGQRFTVPNSFVGKNNYGGIYSNSLCNIVDVSTAATYISLPYRSHNGFKVNHIGESRIDDGPFNRTAPNVKKNSISFTLGDLEKGGSYTFPIDSLRQHTFITGATQYGKTTTIKKILNEARINDIPFIVIEAAKKEYWKILSYESMRNIRVYSCGMDADILYINPFQPENNTMLDTHIQNLIYAFITMFDDGSPIPEVINELVYKCYEKKGWGENDVSQIITSNESEDNFPTLQDMLDNIEEVVDGIGYSKANSEVRDNICGAIRIRIKSLMKGTSNICLNSGKNISISDMFKTSAIIELDDLSEKNRNFLSSIIAMKVSEYSRQCQQSIALSRLLVLEEAHHTLVNTELSSISRNASNCSKHFSDILAEISAYGTGVVIVDQRPSTVSSSAIANTGTKIIHSLKEGFDINCIADALSLQAHEKPMISTLKVGQAIVAIPTAPEKCVVNIDCTLKNSNSFHVGCLFCRKELCTLNPNYDFSIRKVSLDMLSLSLSTRKDEIGSILLILEQYDINPKDYICAIGFMLSKCSISEIIQRQIMYKYITKQGGAKT